MRMPPRHLWGIFQREESGQWYNKLGPDIVTDVIRLYATLPRMQGDLQSITGLLWYGVYFILLGTWGKKWMILCLHNEYFCMRFKSTELRISA